LFLYLPSIDLFLQPLLFRLAVLAILAQALLVPGDDAFALLLLSRLVRFTRFFVSKCFDLESLRTNQ
jgi:hypothetical protein